MTPLDIQLSPEMNIFLSFSSLIFVVGLLLKILVLIVAMVSDCDIFVAFTAIKWVKYEYC